MKKILILLVALALYGADDLALNAKTAYATYKLGLESQKKMAQIAEIPEFKLAKNIDDKEAFWGRIGHE